MSTSYQNDIEPNSKRHKTRHEYLSSAFGSFLTQEPLCITHFIWDFLDCFDLVTCVNVCREWAKQLSYFDVHQQLPTSDTPLCRSRTMLQTSKYIVQYNKVMTYKFADKKIEGCDYYSYRNINTLLSWLYEVLVDAEWPLLILFDTAVLFHTFSSKKIYFIEIGKLQLLGITCLYIALKSHIKHRSFAPQISVYLHEVINEEIHERFDEEVDEEVDEEEEEEEEELLLLDVIANKLIDYTDNAYDISEMETMEQIIHNSELCKSVVDMRNPKFSNHYRTTFHILCNKLNIDNPNHRLLPFIEYTCLLIYINYALSVQYSPYLVASTIYLFIKHCETISDRQSYMLSFLIKFLALPKNEIDNIATCLIPIFALNSISESCKYHYNHVHKKRYNAEQMKFILSYTSHFETFYNHLRSI